MRGRLVEINDAVRLRDAGPKNLTDRVTTLGKRARARAAREKAELACVFVHEDFDQTDGDAAVSVHNRVEAALAAEFGSAHYVLSVWEMEAWLFLFPDALTGVASSWKLPAQLKSRACAEKRTGHRIDGRTASTRRNTLHSKHLLDCGGGPHNQPDTGSSYQSPKSEGSSAAFRR